MEADSVHQLDVDWRESEISCLSQVDQRSARLLREATPVETVRIEGSSYLEPEECPVRMRLLQSPSHSRRRAPELSSTAFTVVYNALVLFHDRICVSTYSILDHLRHPPPHRRPRSQRQADYNRQRCHSRRHMEGSSKALSAEGACTVGDGKQGARWDMVVVCEEARVRVRWEEGSGSTPYRSTMVRGVRVERKEYSQMRPNM